jgi:hypothetical protein
VPSCKALILAGDFRGSGTGVKFPDSGAVMPPSRCPEKRCAEMATMIGERRRRHSYDDALLTARTTLRTGYVRVLVFCNSCRHQAHADMQAMQLGVVRDPARGQVAG